MFYGAVTERTVGGRLVEDDADRVTVSEVLRKTEEGRVHAGDVRWPAAAALSGERGFLPVPVVGVEPFLCGVSATGIGGAPVPQEGD